MGEEVSDKIPLLPSSNSSTKHFVLAHGVSHGGWCWYKVRALLEGSGHRVTCLDLKASGVEPSDPNAVASFDEYNQPLVDLLSSLPVHHKVILVGHSAGGISVTEAIHKFPEKIQAAVYVGATMLKFGYHSLQDLKDGTPDLSEFGDVYELEFGLGRDHPPTSALIKKEFQRKILYQMSPLEDCTLASMLLRPFPLVITEAQTTQGAEDSERVPRIYIKALQDRVLKAEQQEAMIKRWPPTQVYSIDSDHSPFFSNPFVLSGLLLHVANSSFSM